MKCINIISALIFLLNDNSFSNMHFTKSDTLQATRALKQIEIDGLLTEEVWQQCRKITQFTQRDPVEGSAPTQFTEVMIAFDDNALYIAARLYDSSPDSIVALLGRKDDAPDSDLFGVGIDPYLDRRTGYYFALNAAGTFFDGVLYNDDWDDDSWDGVWDGDVQIDDLGWTAEMRIPFSQLRFHKSEQYVWGINFLREINRNNEEDYLVYTPKNGSGFVSRFPVLAGIENIVADRKVELLPYFRTKAEYLQTAAGNPFNDGSRYIPGVGADFKFGLSNNLTVDATINPDFGQVEVDPAVVNLSDVETYFTEKRPFFIEGASIFYFGQGGATNS